MEEKKEESEVVTMSPFKSDKQRKYLHARKPKLAKKWDKKYGWKIKKGKKKK